MSTDDRFAALRRTLPAIADQEHRQLLLAGLAQLEAETAAALALFLQGSEDPLGRLLGPSAGGLVGLPIVVAFAAAAEALAAAVGDDPTRGWAAVATLQERAAEYAAAHQQIISRPAEPNAD